MMEQLLYSSTQCCLLSYSRRFHYTLSILLVQSSKYGIHFNPWLSRKFALDVSSSFLPQDGSKEFLQKQYLVSNLGPRVDVFELNFIGMSQENTQ